MRGELTSWILSIYCSPREQLQSAVVGVGVEEVASIPHWASVESVSVRSPMSQYSLRDRFDYHQHWWLRRHRQQMSDCQHHRRRYHRPTMPHGTERTAF